MPALEDGLSWPALLSLYTIAGAKHGYLLLRRTHPALGTTANEYYHKLFGRTIYQGSASLGTPLNIPDSLHPIWVEIEMRKSFLGTLTSTLYKPPEVSIRIALEDGREMTYRYVPGMGKAGFLLSPLIMTTSDFLLLASSQRDAALSRQRASSFKLSVTEHGPACWDSTFFIRLREIDLPQQRETDAIALTPHLAAKLPEDLHHLPVLNGGIGVIDQLNGQKPTSKTLSTGPFLQMQGWAAVSVQDGVAPDAVFLVLVEPSGKNHYLRAELSPRPDVNAHFKQPEMGNVGFSLRAPLGSIRGDRASEALASRQS